MNLKMSKKITQETLARRF